MLTKPNWNDSVYIIEGPIEKEVRMKGFRMMIRFSQTMIMLKNMKGDMFTYLKVNIK